MKHPINCKLYVVSCAALMLLPLAGAHAQQDSTLNRTVIVENEYNPHIMDATKINALPRVEEPAAVKQDIEYATALRPVAAWTNETLAPITRQWPADCATRGYLRAGYGNYGNTDVKAGYLWDPSQVDRLGIGFALDGWNGTLKDRNEADWSSRFYATRFRLDYAHQFRSLSLRLGGNLGSQVFNYLTVPEAGRTDRQHHTLGEFYVGLASHNSSRPVQFDIQTGLQYFGIKYPFGYENEGNEKKIHTLGDIWGNLDNGSRIGLRFQLDNFLYSADTLTTDYSSLDLNPYFHREGDNWKLHLGLHIDLQGGKDNGVNAAPDVKAEVSFSDSYVFYLQAIGGRELNDYRRLNSFSPYWSLSSLQPTTHVPLNATVGLKASPANGVWFHLFGGYRISNDELSSILVPTDDVYYTRFLQAQAKTAYGGAELKYGYKDRFDTSLSATFYSWQTEHEYEDWFLASKPRLEINFHAEAKVIDGLKLHAHYEFAKREDYAAEGADLSLGNISNLSAGADYEFLKNLSVFGRMNNLLNRRYYHTYGYPAQKLNALAGLSVKF